MTDTAHRLRIPGMVNPAIISRLQGGSEDGIVTENGHVTLVDGDQMFRLDAELEPETEVTVYLSDGHPYCETEEQRRRAERTRQHAKALEEYERAKRKDRARGEAEEFWAQYDIPFDYDIAIKGRRSGLLRGSRGDGRDSRTVRHLFVEEAFTAGRLERDADTYLCNDDATLRHTDGNHTRHDSDGNPYTPPVTCKTCLKRMNRWKK